jgi:hypothetical protein
VSSSSRNERKFSIPIGAFPIAAPFRARKSTSTRWVRSSTLLRFCRLSQWAPEAFWCRIERKSRQSGAIPTETGLGVH